MSAKFSGVLEINSACSAGETQCGKDGIGWIAGINYYTRVFEGRKGVKGWVWFLRYSLMDLSRRKKRQVMIAGNAELGADAKLDGRL